jgi:hypothetical protein
LIAIDDFLIFFDKFVESGVSERPGCFEIAIGKDKPDKTGFCSIIELIHPHHAGIVLLGKITFGEL